MKRRIVSILMALVMALSLLPAQALAEDNNGIQKISSIDSSAGLGSGVYQLDADVTITSTLTITGDTTLDLNNHILKMTGGGSVFVIENGGYLTLTDSTPEESKTTRYFSVDSNTGLWTLTNDTTSTNSVSGGIITGGTGTSMTTGYYTRGGGVLIKPGGQLTMNGGSIVGCKADGNSSNGGGVKVECETVGGNKLNGTFIMNGGAIIGCVADGGGGVETDSGGSGEYGTFIMNGGVIDRCVATNGKGGGVYCEYSFTMGANAAITNCKAIDADSGKIPNYGGGVFLGSSTSPHTLNGTITSEDVDDGNYIFANSTQVNIGATADINASITLAGGTIEIDAKATFTGNAVIKGGSMCALVNDEGGLTKALGNTNFDTIRLMDNITLTDTDEVLSIARAVTLDLNDHVLKRTGSGSVFVIKDGGHLTLTDTATNKTDKHFKKNSDGLWVWDEATGTETVSGGVITGGDGYKSKRGTSIEAYGGGVYIEDGGKLTMKGGNIVGCEARGDNAYGGGVFVSTNGTFTMSGGSITGCIAITTKDSAFGGGIRSEGSTTLSGTAVIRDCHAKGAGKGSYKLSGGGFSDGHTNGTLSISDNVQIIGCTAGGKGSDAMVIMKASNRSITGGTFYGSITGLNNATITDYIVTYRLNNEDYATQVVPSGSKITLPTPAKTGHTFGGWYKADGTAWDHSRDTVTGDLTLTGLLYKGVGTEADFTKALNDKDVEAIRLTQNITLSSGEPNTGIDVAADRKVVLDLNGHVLDLWKKYISLAYDRSNTPNAKKQLTIVDSKPTQEHRFKDNDGLWVLDEQNGTKIVKGGVITGGSSTTTNGGAVYIDTNGTVIMTGGSIVGCTATNGGAVYMNGGAFEMNGGAIIGCKATNGGGVYVEEKGTFTMTDGSIADCAADQGSALYLKGRMNANGGTVDGTVVLVDTDDSERGIQSVDRNNNATTRFTGTVTNNGGDIKHGTFGGLIINNKTNAGSFSVHSPLGIVKNKPSNTNYRTVTFDLADGDKMGYTTRYFLDGGKISSEIKPTRTGYTFGGWYKADGTAWDHNSDTVTGDMTLAARWTACDHSGSTAQPTCTADATCSICGVTINALGHDWGAWVSNDNKTHTRACKRDSTHTETANCTDGNKDHVCDICDKVLSQHSGGTASCAAPATCGYCGKPYGEKNPANHSDLKHVPAKAATTQAEGNSEYWLCSGCGKCYKDAAAATEIALSDTVIAKRIPRRYSGPTITVVGAAYYDGGNVGLTFISSADFDTFTGVQVDGKTLAAKNYIAERGSIEVYLKAVYLRTLKNGSHTVTIQSTAGDVSAVFTVENSKTSPGTSDPGIAVYALSSMLSLTGLAALRRRKED